jgi:hypothetical protein
LGWREEIDIALGEWIAVTGGDRGSGKPQWQRVAAARAGDGPGKYVVDIRSTKLTADQADDLRLAGPDAGSINKGFLPMDVTFDGTMLRLHVAEHADLPDPYLWRLKQESNFLIKRLREEIGNLPDTGLANRLANRDLGGVLSPATAPAWMEESQKRDAYQACLGTGLWLVWGPPGTGKTRLLQSAIGDLLRQGKRVLLASGTNIAVDNALQAVLKERAFDPGEIVRVGAPHLPEVTANPDVSLPLLVRAKLAHVEERRGAASAALREMNDREDEQRSLTARLDGFDPAAYGAAVALLAVPGGSAEELAAALVGCETAIDDIVTQLESANRARDAALAAVAECGSVRQYWVRADELEEHLAAVEEAATQAQGRALLAKTQLDAAQDGLAALEQPGGKVRFRDRRAHGEAERKLAGEQANHAMLKEAAAEAGRIAAATSRDAARRIGQIAASAPLSREEIRRRDAAAEQAATWVLDLGQARRSRLDARDRLRDAVASAADAAELVRDCGRHGWPALHARARELRGETARDSARRKDVQEQHDTLEAEYERLAKDARGEIIAAARLVATTLARLRLVKAVLDGPYDVVLIDEVGAAALPEVLLAVAKAGTCAVLLGDFMQLGPVLPDALKRSGRWEVRKWLVTDAFRHCGVSTVGEARGRQSCLVLDTQHRFGPNIMRLANLIAYDGLLKAGRGVPARAADDPELVLVDTDGLNELGVVHKVKLGGHAGWWPAGLLLSRTLAEMHQKNSEDTGIVTPYTVQAEVTLEALRDVEPSGNLLAEVGTAHRFQGREFPIVVFDTVESEYEQPGWVGQATLSGGDWLREGARLFNVAATRPQHRLYVIASRQRVETAKRGTALWHLAALLLEKRVRVSRATDLIRPSTWDPVVLGPEGTALADVLAQHIEATDINDEARFYAQLTPLIDQARESIWIWSAWVMKRAFQLLPRLEAAVRRGVRVTVFTRDPSDQFQRKEDSVKALQALRDAGVKVVEVNVAHQKAVVVDGQTVMLGSQNSLSQHRTREVMITMQGAFFARRFLTELHAEDFAAVPACGTCGGTQVDLRRGSRLGYYWRCYSRSCPARSANGSKAWTRQLTLSGRPLSSRNSEDRD